LGQLKDKSIADAGTRYQFKTLQEPIEKNKPIQEPGTNRFRSLEKELAMASEYQPSCLKIQESGVRPLPTVLVFLLSWHRQTISLYSAVA
jgi:hypothetical protein